MCCLAERANAGAPHTEPQEADQTCLPDGQLAIRKRVPI